jgi:1,4-alpha-glucan branching enzyme
MKNEKFNYLRSIVVLFALMLSMQVKTQPASTPRIVSYEVHPDRTVTFRILAPDAEKVRFVSSDINNRTMGDKATMIKYDKGVWETTVGPLDPGAYR